MEQQGIWKRHLRTFKREDNKTVLQDLTAQQAGPQCVFFCFFLCFCFLFKSDMHSMKHLFWKQYFMMFFLFMLIHFYSHFLGSECGSNLIIPKRLVSSPKNTPKNLHPRGDDSVVTANLKTCCGHMWSWRYGMHFFFLCRCILNYTN